LRFECIIFSQLNSGNIFQEVKLKNYTVLTIILSIFLILTVLSYSQQKFAPHDKTKSVNQNIISPNPPEPDFAIYDFSQFSSTFTSIAGTSGEVVLGTGAMDDQSYPNRNLGFTFTFDSTAYTSIGVSANGYIIMGGSPVPNNYTILNYTQNDVISAFCADLQSHPLTGRVSYVVTGAPPIRVMTIQWAGFGFYTANGPDSSDCTLQIKLYESSNIVQFVYGSCTSSSTVHNVQAGLRGNSTSDVSSRTTTTNWSATTPGTSTSTCRFQTGVVPPIGLTFQWAAPAVVTYLCENFGSAIFPPGGWSVTAMGTSYLSRSTVSGFCLGTGSLKIDFFNWLSGTQSFTSPIFPAVVSGNGCDSIRFAHAKSGSNSSTDILQIQTSSNGGATWSELVLLSTQLNTAPPQGTAFTPTCTQWGRKSFALPNGTNRIRFNATTAHDNNLYLDTICLLCITGTGNFGNENPASYSLGQNYPNPFNPATKIGYQLPTGSFVTLKVFDIVGHEAAILVNEKQNPGIHEVTFDGTNFASGIYFYELRVQQESSPDNLFVERKKMVLLK
jgi:hypothetical protein